jgi:hypothetical protein
MDVKEGDYVINWSEDERVIDVGRVINGPDENGEYDLGFVGGGSMSPAHCNSAVIPKWVAEFLDAATHALPLDEDTGMHVMKVVPRSHA